MALPPTNPPGLVRDAEDLNKVINGEGTTNRAGDSLPSIKSIIGVVEAQRDAAIGTIDGYVLAVDSAATSAKSAIQSARDGVQDDLDSAVQQIINEGEQAAASTGWFVVGEFSDGFEFTARNQVGRDADGELWSYNGDELPFTVTAGTVPSDPEYTNRGDAALRSELDSQFGAGFARNGVVAVSSIKDLASIPEGFLREDLQYVLSSFWEGLNLGGGTFVWNPGRAKAEHNGGTVVDPDKLPELGVITDADPFGNYFVASTGAETGCFTMLDSNCAKVSCWGAVGNGSFNSTTPLNKALSSPSSTLALEKGVFMVDDIVYIGSGKLLIGQGKAETSIKAFADTLFPRLSPASGLPEGAGWQRTMLTVEGAGSNRSTVSKNIRIESLTVDWNNCPGQETDGGDGSVTAPLMVNSTDNFTCFDVAFANCLPSDYPADPESYASYVSRSHCAAVSSSSDVLFEKVDITTSGYRGFAAAYGSKNVTIRKSTILTANPWRHSIEIHSGGVGYEAADMLIEDCRLECIGGGQEDIICSHGGIVAIINNTFVVNNVTTMKRVIKIFDDAEKNIVKGNRIFITNDEQTGAITLGDDKDGIEVNSSPCRDIIIDGNIIEANITAGSRISKTFPVIGAGDQDDNHENVIIKNNIMRITYPDSLGLYAMNFGTGSNVSFESNKVTFICAGVTEDSIGIALRLVGTTNCNVIGNTVTGEYYRGIFIRSNVGVLFTGIVANNTSLQGVASDLDLDMTQIGDSFIQHDNLVTTAV